MRLAQYPYEFIFAPGRVTINQEAWIADAHDLDRRPARTRRIPNPTFMGDVDRALVTATRW
jgi:hypothetical protein